MGKVILGYIDTGGLLILIQLRVNFVEKSLSKGFSAKKKSFKILTSICDWGLQV